MSPVDYLWFWWKVLCQMAHGRRQPPPEKPS